MRTSWNRGWLTERYSQQRCKQSTHGKSIIYYWQFWNVDERSVIYTRTIADILEYIQFLSTRQIGTHSVLLLSRFELRPVQFESTSRTISLLDFFHDGCTALQTSIEEAQRNQMMKRTKDHWTVSQVCLNSLDLYSNIQPTCFTCFDFLRIKLSRAWQIFPVDRQDAVIAGCCLQRRVY